MYISYWWPTLVYGGPNPPLNKAFAPRFYKTFAPRFYNLLHDLQFAPRFYNLLHDFTIYSTILQFVPRFYNLLHDFTICSMILQFAPRFYKLQQPDLCQRPWGLQRIGPFTILLEHMTESLRQSRHVVFELGFQYQTQSSFESYLNGQFWNLFVNSIQLESSVSSSFNLCQSLLCVSTA